VLGEGALTGVLGAALVAAWFLAYDAAQGRPFHTPSLLGAILTGETETGPVSAALVAIYTLVHVAAFTVFGVVVAALFSIADEEPAVLFALFMLFCCFQVAFVALLMIVAEWALEPISWWAVLVGNVLATAGMLGVLLPRHPAAWQPWLGRRDPIEEPREQPLHYR
jgi:hypothetical protein